MSDNSMLVRFNDAYKKAGVHPGPDYIFYANCETFVPKNFPFTHLIIEPARRLDGSPLNDMYAVFKKTADVSGFRGPAMGRTASSSSSNMSRPGTSRTYAPLKEAPSHFIQSEVAADFATNRSETEHNKDFIETVKTKIEDAMRVPPSLMGEEKPWPSKVPAKEPIANDKEDVEKAMEATTGKKELPKIHPIETFYDPATAERVQPINREMQSKSRVSRQEMLRQMGDFTPVALHLGEMIKEEVSKTRPKLKKLEVNPDTELQNQLNTKEERIVDPDFAPRVGFVEQIVTEHAPLPPAPKRRGRAPGTKNRTPEEREAARLAKEAAKAAKPKKKPPVKVLIQKGQPMSLEAQELAKKYINNE